MIADVVGFTGEIRHDTSKPDGTPRKLLDVSRLFALGWQPTIGLREGVQSTYDWFVDHLGSREAVRGVHIGEQSLQPMQ